MINEVGRKFYIPEPGYGDKKLEFEVNWNTDESVFPCRMLRLKLGKENIVISKNDLMMMMMMFAEPTEMESLIVKKMRQSKHYETVLGIEAKEAIEKGDKIRVPVTISVSDDGVKLTSKTPRKITNIIQANS